MSLPDARGDELRRGSICVLPRELKVLCQLALGRNVKEIAFELGLSPKTVETHRANVMAKLEVDNLASLTRLALREGLIKLCIAARGRRKDCNFFAPGRVLQAMKTFLKILLLVLAVIVAVKLLPVALAFGCVIAGVAAIVAALGVSLAAGLLGAGLVLGASCSRRADWLPILALVGIVALFKKVSREARDGFRGRRKGDLK